MRNIFKITTLVFSVIIFSCSNNGGPSPRAKHLNEKALGILMENPDLSKKQINNCISLLDEATALNSDFTSAHWNKMTFFFMKMDYKRLLETNGLLQDLSKDKPYLIIQEGLIYELSGDTITSKLKYDKGIAIYESILNNDSIIDENFNYEYAYSLMISDQPEKAEKELKRLKKNYPNNEIFQDLEIQSKDEMLQDFIRLKKQ